MYFKSTKENPAYFNQLPSNVTLAVFNMSFEACKIYMFSLFLNTTSLFI